MCGQTTGECSCSSGFAGLSCASCDSGFVDPWTAAGETVTACIVDACLQDPCNGHGECTKRQHCHLLAASPSYGEILIKMEGGAAGRYARPCLGVCNQANSSCPLCTNIIERCACASGYAGQFCDSCANQSSLLLFCDCEHSRQTTSPPFLLGKRRTCLQPLISHRNRSLQDGVDQQVLTASSTFPAALPIRATQARAKDGRDVSRLHPKCLQRTHLLASKKPLAHLAPLLGPLALPFFSSRCFFWAS